MDALKRVAGPVALSATPATVYTAPALTTTTVTAIHVSNTTTLTQDFTLSVGADAVGTRFFHRVPVAPGAAFDWAGTLVLAAGEILQANASLAASLTLTASGVETT